LSEKVYLVYLVGVKQVYFVYLVCFVNRSSFVSFCRGAAGIQDSEKAVRQDEEIG